MTNELGDSLDAYNKSPYLSIKHTTYFNVYDALFSPYRGKDITFVEVGVLNGGSLFMWRSFFGEKARIIGIDLNPAAKKWEDHGFEIYIGSQTDPAFWASLKEPIGPIDLFLDDGGHTYEQQIKTTETLIPMMKDGGLIVVEDTHTSYMSEFGIFKRFSFVNYAKNLVDGINNRFSYNRGKGLKNLKDVWNIRFYESIIVLEIDRPRANLSSEPTSNDGETMDAPDFRYALKPIEETFVYKLVRKFKRHEKAFFITAGVQNSLNNMKLGRFFRF